ncbi:MAG: hypothetical protein M1815_003735 [Lichina confinis]|nr:MAG: hypothetical protein M1815_003735 [Lichina confinis]
MSQTPPSPSSGRSDVASEWGGSTVAGDGASTFSRSSAVSAATTAVHSSGSDWSTLFDYDYEAAVSESPSRHSSPDLHSPRLRFTVDDGDPLLRQAILMVMRIQRVADEINDVEDFGEVSPAVNRQLVMILCRRRQMNTRTVTMLLSPDMTDITIWDAAELKTDDFLRVFTFCPDLKEVLFKEAGQFKDEVLEYVAGHPSIRIEKLRLVGSNLITDPVWCEFFENKGQHLKAFGTGFLDGHFGPAVMAKLVEHGAQMERLKLHSVQKLTWGMTRDISKLRSLCHLTLKRPWDRVTSGTINTIIEAVGHQLQTFCLDQYQHIDDAVLEKIHEKCRRLDKLRFVENGNLTDAGFVRLFTEWENHPLRHIAFDSCRYHNADDPVENEGGVGLCSDGFKAMMAHSGSDLQHVNVRSCRHISHAAFLDVFDGVKMYPKLETVNVAFCGAVDDAVLAGLFRSCPKIKRIWIFGCFAVTTRSPPRDVFLIGHPSADGDLAIHG